MSKDIISRVFSYIVIIFSIMVFPWWITLVLSIVAIIYFSQYYEIIPLLFIMDIIYAVPTVKFHGMVLISFGTAFILVLIKEKLKKQILLPL